MADKILNAFDVWITAQGVKSRTRLRNVDNISLEGIGRLRELILEFAIQGKLVPQNSKDEPATILLAKMAKEESELVQKKIIKKSKELPPIEESEFPFELPKGWAYTRLNNIGEWGAGATPLRGRHDYYGGEIPWFKSGELSSDFISKSEESVTELALKQTSLRYNKAGDVLIAMYGATIGKSSILEVPATTNQAVCACTPFSGVYNVFLLKLLRAYNKRFINMGAGGAQPNISREKIIATVIALPPLAEQHRIVAKVDELMALCDALEQQETHHLKSHQLLVETLLGTLTRAADAKEFQHAWNKLYEHFDDLFTTEDSIDQLKQTIIQLAVMGKLVPQDLNDEPASELLKRIAKERLSVKKKKDEEESYQILESEKLFYLPTNWSWCKFGQLVRFMAYGTSQKTNDNAEDVPVLRMGNITSEGKLVYNNLKYISPDHEDLPALYLENGDIVFNRTNSYDLVGKSGVYNEGPNRYTLASYLIKVSPFIRLTNSEFLNLYINSPLCRRTQIEPQITAQTNQANFSGSKLRSIVVPLPPLNEQARIINKVNELFALCYRLKERIGEAQKVANQMAEGVVV